NGAFDHAICGGVLHFFSELALFFNEVAHLLKPKGVWGFTVSHLLSGEIAADYTKVLDKASGVPMYIHSHDYITQLLEEHNLTLQKQLVFLASVNPETQAEHYGKLYIAQKPK
ncbi:MAG: class I SAM-dependent methyltransferase, partial [bacterium]